MASIIAGLKRRICGLVAHQRAMAAVEFALIVPFMLLLFLGATDLSQGISVDRKLDHTTATIADLLSHEQDGITYSDLTSFVDAGKVLMRPFDAEQTVIRVSVLTVSESGSMQLSQSVGYNGASALTAPDSLAIPSDLVTLARGQYIIATEGWYDYPPLFNVVFDASVPLYKRHFALPRSSGDNFQVAGLPSQGGEGGSSDGGSSGGGSNEDDEPEDEPPPSTTPPPTTPPPSGGGGSRPWYCAILPFLC